MNRCRTLILLDFSKKILNREARAVLKKPEGHGLNVVVH